MEQAILQTSVRILELLEVIGVEGLGVADRGVLNH